MAVAQFNPKVAEISAQRAPNGHTIQPAGRQE